MTSQEQSIRELIAMAQKAIDDEPAGNEVFLASMSDYIESLERWRVRVAPEGGESQVDEQSKAALTELSEIHHRLLERANGMKEGLVGEMGEARKKASALRAYVDKLPQRITITGKRKG